MKVLMINKFLYPNGGSETYMFELGKQLEKMGHEVQYFGMEHEGRCVGNRVDAYTGSMDFHGGSKLTKLTYPLKTIYSSEARQKLRLVLDDFRPDPSQQFQLSVDAQHHPRGGQMAEGERTRLPHPLHGPRLPAGLPESYVLSDGRTGLRRLPRREAHVLHPE